MICLSKSLEKDRTEHSLDAYCGMRVFLKKKIREMPACSNNDDAQICWLQTVARRKKDNYILSELGQTDIYFAHA